MRSKVLVSLLIPGVFGDEVEIFSADNERAVHFGGNDGARQNTAADADFAGEGAFFIYKFNAVNGYWIHPRLETLPTDVGSVDGECWSPESQSYVLVPSSSSRACAPALLGDVGCFVIEEDVRLLLESALALHGEFCGHDCGCNGALVSFAGLTISCERFWYKIVNLWALVASG